VHLVHADIVLTIAGGGESTHCEIWGRSWRWRWR
jgi:hypothetical protein